MYTILKADNAKQNNGVGDDDDYNDDDDGGDNDDMLHLQMSGGGLTTQFRYTIFRDSKAIISQLEESCHFLHGPSLS